MIERRDFLRGMAGLGFGTVAERAAGIVAKLLGGPSRRDPGQVTGRTEPPKPQMWTPEQQRRFVEFSGVRCISVCKATEPLVTGQVVVIDPFGHAGLVRFDSRGSFRDGRWYLDVRLPDRRDLGIVMRDARRGELVEVLRSACGAAGRAGIFAPDDGCLSITE